MSAFDEVFASLRQIMLDAAAGQIVTRDLPGDLVVRTKRMDPKTGALGWFGAVAIKKSYVAYHLMGVYEFPNLAEDMSDGLRKRRQGKGCFNFKKLDFELFSELSRLSIEANKLEL